MKDEFNNAATARINGILGRLAAVPEGWAVVDFLQENNVEICLKPRLDNHAAAASTLVITGIEKGRYRYKEPQILLKEELSDDNILQALIHETQHIRQHLAGVGNPDRILTEAETILFYRLQEADAQAAATDVAFRLKQAGDVGPWQESIHVGYADVCAAFEEMATKDPSSLDDGRARRAAFDAWFSKDARLAHYNRHTVDDMIPFLQEGRDKIFTDHGMTEKPLDRNWLERLHRICPSPYLLQEGAADILTTERYRRDMHLRPKVQPEQVKENPDKAAPGRTYKHVGEKYAQGTENKSPASPSAPTPDLRKKGCPPPSSRPYL